MNKTGVYFIKKGESKVLNDTWVFDKDGQAQELLVKAVVEDGGNLDANGMIKIPKGVKDINVFLRYKILLLGKTARATVKPQLEIESNEVKAGHAASIGQIDEEQLFYLMSRGIAREEAVELMVKAFLSE